MPKVFKILKILPLFGTFCLKACYRGGAVCQEAQSVRRGQDLQRGEEEDLRLDAADPQAGGVDCQGSHEEDDRTRTQEQGY